MPRLPASILVRSILDAFNDSGVSAVLISPPDANPRHFVAQSGSDIVDIWIYIWTLTHGGGSARPEKEYRVQLTGIISPIKRNPNKDGSTILLGYEPNLGCFAGFDLAKHTTFTGRSPSIQIPITTLHSALQNGFSFFTKGNNEIAIGFRPDQLLAYISNAEALHHEGADAHMVKLLTQAASSEQILSNDLEQITSERQKIVSVVERLSRDAGFRRRVTNAYEYRCAVTRMQLRLVDAAHILPVGARGSNDEIYNGLCLSPTYHRAYDRGLIYLDETYVMRLNLIKEQELVRVNQNGGLDDFKQYLDQQIHLPADRNQWPNINLIHQANDFRSIGD